MTIPIFEHRDGRIIQVHKMPGSPSWLIRILYREPESPSGFYAEAGQAYVHGANPEQATSNYFRGITV